MTHARPPEFGPRSGLDHLCAGLAGRGPAPLEPGLMARIRRAAGLLTHPAAVAADLTSSIEALRQAGAGLVALFGPEHGVRGDAPDGRTVPSGVDTRTGLPVYSLYGGLPAGSGPAGSGHGPTLEMLRGLEVLIVDLQDVGARFYTFTSTLSLCMQAAAAAGIPVVVLDRPNPIGSAIEGPLLQPEFASFVGLLPLPIRHGCTIGELARLFHRVFGVGQEPGVVEFGSVGLSAPPDHSEICCEDAPGSLPDAAVHPATDDWRWVPPSPNIPTIAAAWVYPGTCLLEGTNVSEGRGTTRPFEWIGAPWVDAGALAARLRSDALPGVIFRPVHFIPSASKWAGEMCAGVHLHVADVTAFRPVRTGVAILSALRTLWPDRFQWRAAADRYAVDRLAGTDRVRRAIDTGESADQIAATWQRDEQAFEATRAAARRPA